MHGEHDQYLNPPTVIVSDIRFDDSAGSSTDIRSHSSNNSVSRNISYPNESYSSRAGGPHDVLHITEKQLKTPPRDTGMAINEQSMKQNHQTATMAYYRDERTKSDYRSYHPEKRYMMDADIRESRRQVVGFGDATADVFEQPKISSLSSHFNHSEDKVRLASLLQRVRLHSGRLGSNKRHGLLRQNETMILLANVHTNGSTLNIDRTYEWDGRNDASALKRFLRGNSAEAKKNVVLDQLVLFGALVCVVCVLYLGLRSKLTKKPLKLTQ